jgi:hypothetical protein
MNCARFEELLHSRMDGELDIQQAIELGVHAGQCAGCWTLMQDMDRLDGLVLQLPDHPAEGQITRSVLAAAGTTNEVPAGRELKQRWIHGAAASAALLLAAVVLFAVRRSAVEPAAPVPIAIPNQEKGLERVRPANPMPPVEHVADPAPAKRSVVIAYEPIDPATDLRVHSFLERWRKRQEMPEAERLLHKRRTELVSVLHIPKRAGLAAAELLTLADPENRTVWNIAAVVTQPIVGTEVFDAVARRKPEMRLVPVYIAALNSARTKQTARALLCAVSGQQYEAQPEVWMAWWSMAQAKPKAVKNNKKLNG